MCEWRTEETDGPLGLLSASKYLDDENKGSLACVKVITQRFVCHRKHSINPTRTQSALLSIYMVNTWRLMQTGGKVS